MDSPGDTPQTSTQYEFNPDEEETIARFAHSLQNVGMIALFGGVLFAGRSLWMYFLLAASGHATIALLGLTNSFLQVLIGALLIGAGRVMIGIARTEGDDIAMLMRGLRRLSVIYMLQSLAIVCALGVIGWLVHLFVGGGS